MRHSWVAARRREPVPSMVVEAPAGRDRDREGRVRAGGPGRFGSPRRTRPRTGFVISPRPKDGPARPSRATPTDRWRRSARRTRSRFPSQPGFPGIIAAVPVAASGVPTCSRLPPTVRLRFILFVASSPMTGAPQREGTAAALRARRSPAAAGRGPQRQVERLSGQVPDLTGSSGTFGARPSSG